MKNFIRTFIALKITPEKTLKIAIEKLKHDFAKSPIKWINFDDFHLTLHFLGEISAENIEKVTKIIHQRAINLIPFEIEVRGLGAFYKKGHPFVIWAGVKEHKIMNQLFSELKADLSLNGFAFENRPFAPHLTLGRIKKKESPDLLKSTLLKYEGVLLQKVLIKEIYFYESILNPSGPVYRALEIIDLQGIR